jgi:hypothetical protein
MARLGKPKSSFTPAKETATTRASIDQQVLI